MSVIVDDLTVQFGKGEYSVKPLDKFSMRVEPGRLAVLLGPSGCGKTTLLSCLSGMLTPTSGRVIVDNAEVTALDHKQMAKYRQQQIGVVFQAFNLVPSMNALENVMMPMRSAGMKKVAATELATKLLTDVGLGERLGNKPGKLSGGQMQRVAIARALALDPAVVVADEPTANLDHVQVETVLRILRSLTERGHTLIVSTHDQRLIPLADDVIEMDPHHPSHSHSEPHGGAVPTEEISLSRGGILFTEGDPGKHLYRIDHGSIELSHDGKVVETIVQGEVFGEMSPLFRITRTATATAAIDETRLTAFSVDEYISQFGGDEFRGLVARHSAAMAQR
jgi:putative ABC transport system ATP-binding protein